MSKKHGLQGLLAAVLLIVIIVLLRILFRTYTYQDAIIYLFMGVLVTVFLIDGLLQLSWADYLRWLSIFSVLFVGAVSLWFMSSSTNSPDFYVGANRGNHGHDLGFGADKLDADGSDSAY